MGRYILDTKNFIPGTQTIKFSNLVGADPTGVQYLDRIELVWTATALTTGNGGQAVTPYDLHNLLSQCTVSDGKKPWGPNNVSGVELAASRFLATGRALPFASNVNGDNSIANATGPVTRQWKTIFDFSAYGGKFSPAASVFGPAGFINLTMANPQSGNMSTANTQLSVTAYAETHGERVLRAVPRLMFESNILATKNYDLGISGLILQHSLENLVNGTGIVASDILNLTLTGADGTQLLQTADILGLRPEEYTDNPEITNARMLRHFCDSIGGTNPYFAPIYPRLPTSKAKQAGHQSIENNVVTSKVSAILTGGMNVANYANNVVYAEVLEDHAAAQQMAALGAPNATTVHETSHGGAPSSKKLHGFLPKIAVK